MMDQHLKRPERKTEKLLFADLENKNSCALKEIRAENLHLSYGVVFAKKTSDAILAHLEENIDYNSAELSKIKIFGKTVAIPRKQTAFGDDGQTYRFSGVTVAAKPWPPLLLQLRQIASVHAGTDYNFVLVNRYKDGNDYIGEHKDDEKELDKNSPIASMSFGAARDFLLRHENVKRRKRQNNGVVKVAEPENVKLSLEHGSLLLMCPPTNNYWYHSLPVRKAVLAPRINLTFRKLIPK